MGTLLRGNETSEEGRGGANIKRQSSLEIITTGGDVNVKATKKWQRFKEERKKKEEKKRIYTSA